MNVNRIGEFIANGSQLEAKQNILMLCVKPKKSEFCFLFITENIRMPNNILQFMYICMYIIK